MLWKHLNQKILIFLMQKKNYKIYQNKLTILILIQIQIIKNYQNH